MAEKVPYGEKKDLIRAEIMKLARAQPIKLMTYADFGRRVGIPSRGPWKPILDLIAEEETGADSPDITFLIVNKRTGYPGQIGLVTANPPSPAQRRRAREEFERIAARYSPGSPLPLRWRQAA